MLQLKRLFLFLLSCWVMWRNRERERRKASKATGWFEKEKQEEVKFGVVEDTNVGFDIYDCR